MLKLDRLADQLHDKWGELVEADRQEREAREPADTNQDPLEVLLEPEPDEPETPRSVKLMREYRELLEQWDDAQNLDCSRCGGSGRYGPTHIMGGDCFRCGGSGRDPAKAYQDPPTPTDPASVLDDMHRT